MEAGWVASEETVELTGEADVCVSGGFASAEWGW